MRELILYGARSPLVVDYEETAKRLGIVSLRIIDTGTGTPRALDRAALLVQAKISEDMRGLPFIACAFSPARRAALVAEAEADGFRSGPALIDPTAVVASSARIGDGAYLNAGVIVGGGARIARHALVNRASSIGHHSTVGSGASIGPGAHLASNVHVGQGAVIGAGSTILPDIRIGAGAIVAAGSVVRADVADDGFVAGNPAKPRAYDRAKGIFGQTNAE